VGAGHTGSADVARSIFEHSHAHLAGYKRIRRLEFAELPKTISGKIRRVDLRAREQAQREQPAHVRAVNEYWEEDFPDLRS
jgi:acetyl-CoA synthetase